MELFDFASLIGCHIEFVGSYGPKNTYVNASLVHNALGVLMRGWSIFGRSEDALLEDALVDLAVKLKERETLVFYNDQTNQVPDNLTHTPGYRPKKKAT